MGVLRSGCAALCCASLMTGCGIGKFSESERIGKGGGDVAGEPADDDSKVGPGPGAMAPGSECASLGPRLIRRLTSQQFHNTLVDVFEDANVPREDVLTDPLVEGFRTNAAQAVIRDLGAQQLMSYAEKVAAWAVANKLTVIAACQSLDADCRRQTIQSFGGRAYREPLSDETVALYDGLFASESSFTSGLKSVVSAMLQSPYFLYRRELGQPSTTGNYVLTPHQIAENLSYLLTDGPPDAELRTASDQGALETAEEIDAHARRLLASDRSRAPVSQFLLGWLRLDKLASKAKDETRFPLSPELRADMLQESEELFMHTLREGYGTKELLSAQYTFVSPELAAFYQLPTTGQTGLQKADLTGQKRAPGLLGHGAFLATHALSDATSPVQRGVAIRERMFCQKLPPPPVDVDTNLDAASGAGTNRERYAEHSTNTQCNGCHRLIDSIGFTLERYDAIGRYSEQENGQVIDDSGGITDGPDGDVTLDGAADLMGYLAESSAVEACLVEQYTFYSYGVDEWSDHACALAAIDKSARDTGGSLESMLLSIVHAAHFTTRAADL